MTIRLTVPSIEEDDLKAVRDVLISGYLVQGIKVDLFERAIADYVGTRFAVAVSSCTAALHIALKSLNVGPGDIVVTTAYSFTATANVIELCGAEPIFVDIDPQTFNMDPQGLEMVLQNVSKAGIQRRVKAIMPVHTFGCMADMESICRIAARYELPVVEDAACALGATIKDRQAGTWGMMGCFSFHPRKTITTGEGGVITTNDSKIADNLNTLRNHGLDARSEPARFLVPGFNYRLTEMQAALGLSQIGKLERVIAARRKLAMRYDELFQGTSLQTLAVSPENRPTYQSYVVLLPEGVAMDRDAIIAKLKCDGIEATIGTWHIPLTAYFEKRYGYKRGDFEIADSVFDRALTIPLHEHLRSDEQSYVASKLLVAIR